MTPRHVRALRGTTAAWVATIVAATGHTLGGGGAPSPAFVIAIGVLAAPLAVVLAGRRLATWRVALTVALSQALFHGAFALTAGADPSALHGHHVGHLAGHLGTVVLPDAPMLVAHAVAAVVTVAALTRGERMLRALGRGIRSLFPRLAISAAPLVFRPLRVPVRAAVDAVGARVVLSDLSRRGPPGFV